MVLGAETCHRHLSGLNSVRLYDVGWVEGVTLHSSGAEFGEVVLCEGCEALEVVPVEKSASYKEVTDSRGEVEHRLEFSLRGCRPECVKQVQELCRRGVIAEIATPNGERLLVGYSRRAGADYPLGLASATATTSTSEGGMPDTTLLLASMDAWPALVGRQ